MRRRAGAPPAAVPGRGPHRRYPDTPAGTDPQQGRREDTGEHYLYIHDPDGNLIELVYHPLGAEDTEGKPVEPTPNVTQFRWTQIPNFVASEYRQS